MVDVAEHCHHGRPGYRTLHLGELPLLVGLRCLSPRGGPLLLVHHQHVEFLRYELHSGFV